MLLNDLMKQLDESVEQTGPKFTGYWKSKDPAPAGKKMVGEEEKTLEASTLDTDIEFEPGPDTEFDKKELAALLTQKLTNLAPKEERAIRLKIFYDYTFDQIGEKFGVTGTRARDIFNRGIRKLKHPSRSREMRPFLEDENPTDKVTMDIPLFLRMMEYAKEDAKTDMDLHDVTERAIALMKEHEYLCMDNYNDLVGGEATGGEQPTNEFKDTAKYGDDSGKNINHEIFQLLKNGATVYSNAAGRMGKVLRANNDGVVIASKRGKGFTSFNSGDPVKIKQDENEPNTYHIINEEKKGLYYNVNKRKKAGTSRPKGHPKAPSEQDWKNAAKTAKEDVTESQLEEGLLGQAIGLIGAYYGVQAGLPDVIMNTMDLPTGTYTIVQHLLGGGAGYVGGVVLGNAAGKATKKLIAKMLWTAIKKAYQSIKGGTPEQQAMKNLDAEVKAIEARIKQSIATGGKAEPKLFKDQPVKTEGKIKGADGKACWKGYRYAGTEDGKDKCVPVKKGK